MWINYSDSEVRKFHPICSEALNKALRILDIENFYSVEHHEMFGTIEADFVIKNRTSGRYLCVIEVKRTLSDVQSTRYQYQAMSYVQSAGTKMEKPFYMITNLEYSYCFRFDPNKSSNLQQMMEPGLIKCAKFEELDEEEFIDRLSNIYAEYLKKFIDNQYRYIVSIDKVLELIEDSKRDILTWRTNIAILAYEYIRGAFESVGRNDLKNIHLFLNDAYSICEDASLIDFSPIFKYDRTEINRRYDIDNDVLNQIYNFGKQNINGEVIANMIHQIVSRGHEDIGEVPTDIELAYYISYIAKIYNDNKKIRVVCDPAAGSGSLIGAAINVLNLAPIQVKANDINEKLLQVLSIRLGLSFVDTINLQNTVNITNKDISSIEKDYFNNVDILLMNPPYVSGIREGCREKKEMMARRIYNLSNRESITNVGQIGLECVFTELISTFIKDGTICACIIPKQYLFGIGRDSIEFRKFIINEFGLKAVFIYPSASVFRDVIKDTVVIVGEKGTKENVITSINSMINIQDLDANEFIQMVQDNYYEVQENNIKEELTQNNISIKNITRERFIEDVNDGWNFLSLESIEKENYIKELNNTNKLIRIENSELFDKMSRGRAGNSGGSDLIFAKEKGKKSINAVRNAKLENCLINIGDSYFELDESEMKQNIKKYINIQNLKIGRQNKKSKNEEQLESICKEARNSIVENSILIPRNLRKHGTIYYTIEKCLVSTNFMMIENLSEEKLIEITSWMRTSFYQCICEIYAKPQEGTRKLEKEEISKTLIPYNVELTSDEIELLKKLLAEEAFIELDNPNISELDKFWAKKIFEDNYEEKLITTNRLLRLLASLRQNRL